MNEMTLIMTSVDEEEAAQGMAQALVEQKLAACVQVSPAGTSVYVWDDEVCRDSEFYLNIKTDDAHLDAVISWLEANHPYETPEIVTLNAKASRDYHDWLTSSLL